MCYNIELIKQLVGNKIMESAWDFGFGDYHTHLNQFSGIWQNKKHKSIKITILKMLLNTFGDRQFYFVYQDSLGTEFLISLKDLEDNFIRITKFNIE